MTISTRYVILDSVKVECEIKLNERLFMFYQQGDVLIKKISELPQGKTVERRQRGFVLADGEVTGHAHVIEDNIKMVEVNGVLFIGCESDVTVKHEEHGAITIPAGNYQIGIVQEYDHFAEEARNVVD